MIDNVDEVNYLIGKLDPYNLNKMTFSDIIQLLSSHMVMDDSNPSDP